MYKVIKIYFLLGILSISLDSYCQSRDIIKPDWEMMDIDKPVWQLEILKDKKGKRIEHEVYDKFVKTTDTLYVSCLRHIPSKQEFCIDDVVSIKDYEDKKLMKDIKTCTIWFFWGPFTKPYDEKFKTHPFGIGCREVASHGKGHERASIEYPTDTIKMIKKCTKSCTGR